MAKADRTLALGAVVVLLLALLFSGRDRGDSPGGGALFGHSSYSRAPGGCKALYTVLQQLGYPVRRWRAPLETLDQGSVLVVAGAPSVNWDAVRQWVGRGHVAIMSTDPRWDTSTGADTTLVRPVPWGPTAGIGHLGAYGSHRVETGDEGPPDALLAAGAPLAADARGPLVVWVRSGRGGFLLLHSTLMLANQGLGDGDNIRLVLNAIALSPASGPVLFDEFDQGYRDETGLWEVLPGPVRVGLLQGILGAILWMGVAAVRVRPPLKGDAPERSRAEYLASLASLMGRAHHPRLALEQAGARLPADPRSGAWRQQAATMTSEEGALRLVQEARALQDEARRRI